MKKELILYLFVSLISVIFLSEIYAFCGDGICDFETESWYDEPGKTKCLDNPNTDKIDDCLPPPEACSKFSCEDLSTEDVKYFCADNKNYVGNNYEDLLPSGYTHEEEENRLNLNDNGYIDHCFCSGQYYRYYGKAVCSVTEEQNLDACKAYDRGVIHESNIKEIIYDSTTDEYKNAGCDPNYSDQEILSCYSHPITDYLLHGGNYFSDCNGNQHCRYEPTKEFYRKYFIGENEKEICYNEFEGEYIENQIDNEDINEITTQSLFSKINQWFSDLINKNELIKDIKNWLT